MFNRVIKSRAPGSSVQLVGCLASLFTLELLNPGKELYLISPWLSQVTLIDNRFGQFRALISETGKSALDLGDILTLIAARGTQVRILYRRAANVTTGQFVESVQGIKNIECRPYLDLHEKGLVTSRFYLRGSMNFTYAGVNINGESVELTNDESMVWKALQEAKVSWEGAEEEYAHIL
jgi:hypothetical protein